MQQWAYSYWINDAPLQGSPLSNVQSHYQECFATLTTNSHIAEYEVKASNVCTLTSWPEYLLSAYGTARSGLVDPIHL
jgi:hypothetical protein